MPAPSAASARLKLDRAITLTENKRSSSWRGQSATPTRSRRSDADPLPGHLAIPNACSVRAGAGRRTNEYGRLPLDEDVVTPVPYRIPNWYGRRDGSASVASFVVTT